MKYFTLELVKSDDVAGWNSNRVKYWENFERISEGLPQRLVELHKQNSLHDAIIFKAIWRKKAKEYLLIIDGCRNGPSDDTDPFLFILHFIDVESTENNSNLKTGDEILYVEIDSIENGLFEFRVLLDNEQEWSIQFGRFDFYAHDYRKPDTFFE